MFSYKGITIKILPGIFHPGLFFSTKVFLKYLGTRSIVNKQILELGAGSGLISIYCYQNGARVTATDISKTAIQGIQENARMNNAQLKVIESDLFDRIDPIDYDIIIINPPYYPKAITSEMDMPWFCGEHFEYFEKLFRQLKGKTEASEILMILSEDCELNQIKSIAQKNSLRLVETYSARKLGEWNFIYEVSE